MQSLQNFNRISDNIFFWGLLLDGCTKLSKQLSEHRPAPLPRVVNWDGEVCVCVGGEGGGGQKASQSLWICVMLQDAPEMHI